MTDKDVKKAPKKSPTKSDGSAKEARNKTPKKQGWKLVFSAILMMIWVGMSVIAAQLMVGYVMIWLIGVENFQQPVGQAFYTALSYIVALLLAILVPANLSVKWELAQRGAGARVRDMLPTAGDSVDKRPENWKVAAVATVGVGKE